MRKDVELAGTSCAGRSILEMYWERLDCIVDILYSDWDDFEEEGGTHSEWHDYGQLQGQCSELSYAIAIMTNPYAPDVDAIRDEAMERYDG